MTEHKLSIIRTRDVVCILFSAIIATLASQIFVSANIKMQAKVELEKDLVLQHIHIYNHLTSILEMDSLVHLEFDAPTAQIQHQITMDMFGNEIGDKKITNDEVKYQHYKLDVPVFVTNNVYCDRFNADIEYLNDNLYQLDPNIFKAVSEVVNYIHSHPIPTKERRASESYACGWDKAETRKEFFLLVKKAYDMLDAKCEEYGLVKAQRDNKQH